MTEFFTKAKDKLLLWKIGWFRVFLYSSMTGLATFVALTENWSDIYLQQLHIPTAFFALVIVAFKCWNVIAVSIIAYLDQTIQGLKEELKNKHQNESEGIENAK